MNEGIPLLNGSFPIRFAVSGFAAILSSLEEKHRAGDVIFGLRFS